MCKTLHPVNHLRHLARPLNESCIIHVPCATSLIDESLVCILLVTLACFSDNEDDQAQLLKDSVTHVSLHDTHTCMHE